ncbi:SCO family protein [Pseudorhodoferax soli]|uniref:Protein SCO1/2 n=1 Tax=Pseudorhodoferax soli TaxID=545864 RepID=A0A368XFT4_9BURK|nr:SCO family protein [Pseudorhodoferax soli]PZP91297.1 MAG: SCO family protein [Variovorax paradoxus]PZQ01099.1 MAG: SCO family protein [Variovorax paradoxus]RCW66066.1 protein SCO1/2 [Pseudorhodoferax soli]
MAVLLAAACSKKPPANFASTDITGAGYAQGFSLADHNGQRRTLQDFKGKAVAIFFGFTQCPDVCPTTLAEMSEVKTLLGADGERLQVLLVTVDPERDKPQVLKAYTEAFDPAFLALRPTEDELKGLASDFKVYFKKVGDSKTAYTMDHSAGTYIFDPQGRIRLYSRYGSGAKDLFTDIRQLLDGA